jgi:hypothetical protein
MYKCIYCGFNDDMSFYLHYKGQCLISHVPSTKKEPTPKDKPRSRPKTGRVQGKKVTGKGKSGTGKKKDIKVLWTDFNNRFG